MGIDFDYKRFDKLESAVIKDIIELEGYVFPEPLSQEKIESELATKFNLSIYIAYNDQKPIGYKVGFERSKRIYYSWIGGIHPDHRCQGVAKNLMKLQHEHAKELGYKVVCTQTDNSFKEMLILNLKSGFDIKGTIQSTGDNYITIVLEKSL